jgi:RNA polymerase sigma-70 factor (ECF subfamily)
MPEEANDDRHDHFLRLYVEHEEAVRCFLLTLLPGREEAREVMQGVAMVLWRKFDSLSSPADFRRWAFGVARMEALTFSRDRQRDRLVFDEEVLALLADEVDHETEAYAAEREALDECLGKLEPAQRKLLEAAYEPGARIDELAVAMGRTPMSFYKALHRIRLALMDCTQRVLIREGMA